MAARWVLAILQGVVAECTVDKKLFTWDGKYGPGAENPRIIRPKRRRRKYGAHMGAGRDVAHRDVSCRRTCTETLNICLPRQPEARLGSVLHALVVRRRLRGLARCVALTKGRLAYRCHPAGPRHPLSTSRFAPGGVGGRATYAYYTAFGASEKIRQVPYLPTQLFTKRGAGGVRNMPRSR
jgi:hypothetical protein